MEFLQAFPIAIIDEDFEGKSAAGRALVQETIDEALSFRRVMAGVKKQFGKTWWFNTWQPDAMAKNPTDVRRDWVLKPGGKWHGFEGLARTTKSIQDYLKYARDFDSKFPGFETDIRGVRFVLTPQGRRYLVDCVKMDAEEA